MGQVRKWYYFAQAVFVACMLPFSAAIGGADGAKSEVSTDTSDGNRTRIVKRSKYLDTVKDSLTSDKLKKIPVRQELRKGFRGMKDPTRPTKGTVFGSAGSEQVKSKGKGKQIKVSSASLALTSTIVSPGRRTAIINGKTVTKGDKINGAVILGIFPASVKIKKNNKVSVLDMSSREIKKPSR